MLLPEPGMAQYGMVWHGMAWHSMARHHSAQQHCTCGHGSSCVAVGLWLYLPVPPPAAGAAFPGEHPSSRSETLSSRSTLKHPAFYF